MNKFKTFFSIVIIAFVFILVAFVTYNLVEPKVYDFMTKQFTIQKLPFDEYKKVYGSDEIILVMVDSKTVEKYRWPWKRSLDVDILSFFSEYAKPKIIIDDTIFVTLDKDYPESDKLFFKKIKTLNNYIAGFMPKMTYWEEPISGEKYEEYFAKKYSIKVKNEGWNSNIAYGSMISSPYQYLESANNLGHVYLPHGGLNKNISYGIFDKVTRSNEYILEYKDEFYPSLAMKAFMMLNNPKEILIKDKKIIIKGDEERVINLLNKSHLYSGINKIVLDTYSNPIRFYKTLPNSVYSHKSYSVVDILSSYYSLKSGKTPVLNPEIFKDKIVVLGANVPAGTGLNDNKHSPVTVKHAGADLQATVVDNILNNDFLRVIPNIGNIIITMLGMVLVYLFIRRFNISLAISATLQLIIYYLLVCIICFYSGIIINVITPIVMFIMTTIVAYIHKYIIENRNKEKVKSAMGKYMSQDVMREVVENIDHLGLGGKKSVVTVLFADIRGFTTMSEQMSAQEVSEILNEYFTEMEPIITRYNGVINKFIGDAVMAIFGEPIQDKNHAKNAVKCAYAMLKRVEALQKKWERVGKPKIEIGIGINTGEVFVGNIGSVNRMEYTVIGDTVNIASRLETYNKKYRTHLLISPATYNEVKGFTDVIKIPEVQIRGRANKMDIYEVLKVAL